MPSTRLPEGIWMDEVLTIRARTAEMIRELILSGKLTPGQRLNEVELAARIGVSRGPLREALQHLAAENLVSIRSHHGSYVRTLEEHEVRELYDVRKILESAAAAMVAKNHSALDLETLRELLERTDRLMEENAPSPYPAKLDFHAHLVTLTGNQSLVQVSRDVQGQLALARSRSGYQLDRARDAYEEHWSIFEAISSGQSKQASLVIERHLARACESAIKLMTRELVSVRAAATL